MKLGSLFSGSGGFELAGALNGVEPVWCSEIEPYPIAVTRSRFPSMKHYGDVSKVNGAEVESVDIITFGSPCQDLSIAGKREGIEDGARSSLFFQAVRIIKEMREATHGEYPRFAVWENVPGAFSSNKGNDFRLVLEALASVSEPEVSIPASEKWQRAGEIVGNGWSIAWRTLDAQYWGVPQRRKRIYLVADFGGERAGDILFKPDSVLGYPAQSGEAREGTAADATRGVGGSCAFQLCGDRDAPSVSWSSIAYCVPANPMSDRGQAVCYPQIESRSFRETGGDAEKSVGRSCGVHCLTPWDTTTARIYDTHGVFATLQAGENCGMQRYGVMYPQIESRSFRETGGDAERSVGGSCGFGETGIGYWQKGIQCLRAEGENRPSRPSNVVVSIHDKATRHQGGGDTRNNDGSGNGLGVSEDGIEYTLPGADRHGVAYAVDCRNMCLSEELSSTLQAKENGGQSLNYQNPVVYPTVAGTLCASGAGTQRPAGQANEGELCVVFSRQRSDELVENNVASCQSARQYKDATDLVVANARPPRKYIVRRLTPTECARLQGFPDTWGNLAPYDSDDAFWQSVYKTACEIKGGKFTPKKDLRKWYNGLRTDSAEYRMWGNAIALPCAEFVLRSIADEMNPGAWLY